MPTTPPKKKRTGLIALIIVLAVILVGAGVFFGVRAVIGHRLTSYCQTYISLSDDMTNWSQELSDAATAGDAEKISSSLDSMITGFTKLQDANPPDTVAPALDSFVKGFTAVKQATDTDGLEGFLGSFTAYTNEISEAGKTIDDASVAYCN